MGSMGAKPADLGLTVPDKLAKLSFLNLGLDILETKIDVISKISCNVRY